MDGWKGNRKFWAGGSVFATVDLIWVTLCYRKLAEELGDPPPPPSLEVRMEGTGTCTHSKHTHAQTQHPSPKLNSLFTSIISP